MNITFLPVSTLSLLAGSLLASSVSAHTFNRVDAHAPIGVMGDHYHKQGEWMFSLRGMTMNMERESDMMPMSGMSSGMSGMTMMPKEMTSTMYMLGGMYGLNDDMTLMMSFNYKENEMDSVNASSGMTMSMDASGFGDVKFGSTYRLHEGADRRLHAVAMLSIPTGSIDETATMASGMAMPLSPMMQVGSGTYDLAMSLTYVQFRSNDSLGMQFKHTVRLEDENDEGYKLPNVNDATLWYAYKLNDFWSVSPRLRYFQRNGVDNRWDGGLGVNYKSEAGHRLALEYLSTLEHDTDMMMEMQDALIVGYQYSF